MANVFDVADYILSTIGGNISTLKLQKLCYYSYVERLVTSGQFLFPEKFQAWANGPVCKELFDVHKGLFTAPAGLFRNYKTKTGLNTDEMSAITRVLETYGLETADELSVMTHNELPWENARNGCSDNENCENEISAESILDYYKDYDCYHTYGIKQGSLSPTSSEYKTCANVDMLMSDLGI